MTFFKKYVCCSLVMRRSCCSSHINFHSYSDKIGIACRDFSQTYLVFSKITDQMKGGRNENISQIYPRGQCVVCILTDKR